MLKYCFPVIIIIFFLQGIAIADYYKWEDENGGVHITDYPPPAKTVKNVQVHKYESESSNEPAPAEKSQQDASKKTPANEQNTEQRKNHDVVLYTTSWCPWCKKARDFFTSRNIYFTDYDIEKDKEAAQRKKQLDNKDGVPFAIINGQSIHGYNPAAYENALQKNR